MKYKIDLQDILKIISQQSFVDTGDSYEKNYQYLFENRFPNCEIFWKDFVVPYTNRIDTTNMNSIRARDNISEDIEEIGSLHYSMYLNLIYAHKHLLDKNICYFEDFYIHLGTVFDLCEEFLFKIYLLLLECGDKNSIILQKLSQKEFISLTKDWYKKNYIKIYNDFLIKGKTIPICIPTNKNILNEYFGTNQNWKTYKKYIQIIKEYRNIIAHHIQIGKIYNLQGDLLVPKKEKIKNYKKWQQVFDAAQNQQQLSNDFIEIQTQMNIDITDLERILNKLWEKPINDIYEEIYVNKNLMLLNKFNLDIG